MVLLGSGWSQFASPPPHQAGTNKSNHDLPSLTKFNQNQLLVWLVSLGPGRFADQTKTVKLLTELNFNTHCWASFQPATLFSGILSARTDALRHPFNLVGCSPNNCLQPEQIRPERNPTQTTQNQAETNTTNQNCAEPIRTNQNQQNQTEPSRTKQNQPSLAKPVSTRHDQAEPNRT